MSYWQFLLFCVLGLGIVATVVVKTLLNKQKKAVALRFAAILVSVAVSLFLLELGIYSFSSTEAGHNPWYLTGDGTAQHIHPDLPFRRKAFIDWKGMSHGDLVQVTNDKDPFAREVAFVTDKDGFRNSRAISAADIVFIGDSHTEAGNIPEDETFIALLGKQLNATVKNLGTALYSTPHELVVLHEYGLPCKPKVVILQISETNDLAEAAGYMEWEQRGKPAPQFKTTQTSRIAAWKRNSPTWFLYRSVFPGKMNYYPWEGLQTTASGTQQLVRFYPIEKSAVFATNHVGWTVMKSALGKFHSACLKNKIHLVVLYIPDKLNVLKNVAVLNPEARKLAADIDVPESKSLAWNLAQQCRQLGITFINPYRKMVESSRAGAFVYQPFDTHLDVGGHQLVARQLAAAISKLSDL